MKTDKNILRKKMSEKRNQLSEQEVDLLSKQIADKIVSWKPYQDAKHIGIYQAFRKEVDCKYILQHAFTNGKHVYVPVTDQVNKTMDFYEVFEDTEWKSGAYGIMEPVLTGLNRRLEDDAVIFMPGLLFDREKHRIGYGGGYYDKYLSGRNHHIKAGLCYGFQIMDCLPHETYDIMPDYIISEQEII